MPPDDLARVRRVVEEEVLFRVVEAVERAVHARFGANAIVRVRRVPVTWRIGATAVDDPRLADELAADLVSALIALVEALPAAARLLPPADAPLALFEDQAHADAVALAGLATRTPVTAPPDAPPDVASAWRAIAARGEDHVHAALGWLERLDVATAAIAAADDVTLAQVAAVAPPARWSPALRAIPRVAMLEAEHASRGEVGRAAEATVTGAAPGERQAAAREVEAAAVERAAIPSNDTPRAEPNTPPPGDAPVPERIRDGGEALSVADGPATARDEVDAVATHFAGAACLVGRVLELDLAEQLWCAGLSEGPVIAHVIAAVLGDAGDDPLWRWLGGCFAGAPALDPVPAWADSEIVTKQRDALGRRLVRWHVETTPAALEAVLDRIAGEVPARCAAADAAHMVARLAAGLVTLVAARLGEPPSVARVRALAARPGRAVRTRDRLVVAMPMSAVDLDVRRAGLDASPGWVPWLRRSLAIEFVAEDGDVW